MRDYVIDFNIGKVDLELLSVVGKIKKTKGVLAVYVFGSYIKEKMGPLSDVDLCIVGDISSRDKRDVFFGKFPELFDVNFFEDLPVWMRVRVLRDGKCLFVKNERSLNLIKLLTIKEYLDFKPVIDDIIKKELALDV